MNKFGIIQIIYLTINSPKRNIHSDFEIKTNSETPNVMHVNVNREPVNY